MPTTITVANAADEVLFPGRPTRRVSLEATADRDLATMALPAETVEALGLELRGRARVRRYGLQERALAGSLVVEIGERQTVTTCVVSDEAVVGLTVMTALDLVEDPETRVLRPRRSEWVVRIRAGGRPTAHTRRSRR